MEKSVRRDSVDLLMYHSISEAPGPTSMPPSLFRQHLDILAACGYQAVSLADFTAWHGHGEELPPRAVVITFDDGFADFAEQAYPALAGHGWSATVFLPSGRLGGQEDWEGADPVPRPLMSWDQVNDLAEKGIDFGSHSISHADLTALSPEDLEEELGRSRDQIARHLGQAPVSFAPPYGRSNAAVRSAIAGHYEVSVGTRLARAGRSCDLYDLPRIEMHYFRDAARWQAYLEGRAESYFLARRVLRRARQLASFA